MELAVASLDEWNIAEAASRHISDRLALTLEDGVGRNGGAEPQELDSLGRQLLRNAVQNARDRIARHRRHFPDLDAPALQVIGNEVGEGPAYVDAQQHIHQKPRRN